MCLAVALIVGAGEELAHRRTDHEEAGSLLEGWGVWLEALAQARGIVSVGRCVDSEAFESEAGAERLSFHMELVGGSALVVAVACPRDDDSSLDLQSTAQEPHHEALDLPMRVDPTGDPVARLLQELDIAGGAHLGEQVHHLDLASQ